MQREECRDHRARPPVRGDALQKQEQKHAVRNVDQCIDQQVSTRIETKHLDVDHMRRDG